jgi:hypothetical protein
LPAAPPFANAFNQPLARDPIDPRLVIEELAGERNASHVRKTRAQEDDDLSRRLAG